jgi:hypothetical protein
LEDLGIDAEVNIRMDLKRSGVWGCGLDSCDSEWGSVSGFYSTELGSTVVDMEKGLKCEVPVDHSDFSHVLLIHE